MTRDIIVVGGGITGLATALRLLEARPALRLTLVEKEPALARHQTGHNSGVLHAGLYYAPGSRKAALAAAGLREMIAFCRDHALPWDQCGKIVVATRESEVPALQELWRRGHANGLSGLRWLRAGEIAEREPHAAGVAAVHVPEEGIVDFVAVAGKMGELVERLGGEVRTRARALRFVRNGSGWMVETSAGSWGARVVVTCGGLHADRLVRMAGGKPGAVIVPFRGEYYRLRPERAHLVRGLIYPVPDATFPFLGVHFTRTIGGDVEAGPNAVLALAREGYRRRDVNVRDLAGSMLFPGLWRFLAAYPGMCAYELRRSFSRAEFARSLRKLVPAVEEGDLLPGGAGVRAQAMTRDGRLVQDFVIDEGPGMLHVVNAPSPGATASLALGRYIAGRALEQLGTIGR